jgi:hypothetical protein
MNIRQLIEALERMEKAYGPHVKVHIETATGTEQLDGLIYEQPVIILETQ